MGASHPRNSTRPAIDIRLSGGSSKSLLTLSPANPAENSEHEIILLASSALRRLLRATDPAWCDGHFARSPARRPEPRQAVSENLFRGSRHTAYLRGLRRGGHAPGSRAPQLRRGEHGPLLSSHSWPALCGEPGNCGGTVGVRLLASPQTFRAWSLHGSSLWLHPP